MFELPKLPYEMDALEPYISHETLEYHYGKHHQTYVNNLNKFVQESPELQGKTLEDIIKESTGGVFNNAAQVWNHTFYWNSLSPQGGGVPGGNLGALIQRDFGDFEGFQSAFSQAAAANFGSGWTWLALSEAGKVEIVSTDDAKTLLNTDYTPLLVIDVWEHAYYIDYRNARPKYIDAFWNLVNWDFALKNLNS